MHYTDLGHWKFFCEMWKNLKAKSHAPMDTLSLTKEARIYNGLKTISLTSASGKTGQPP